MRTEISTAAAFVTRLLRAAGGIGEEQLRCFRECLQEALRGERGPGPVGVRGAAAGANAALCSLPQSTTSTTGSPRRRPRAPGTGALESTIRWTR